ncbi:type VI secretion system protein TssA [Enterovibrio sp. ZSDZ35]|uniref:Type VI secretion system protein TssA n=1 Tax=Enterovibrio qingdaonensis TaxID=2899818 RepID=A0ABT5QHQ5_9GAMM|nr:type VI secretion system protein TssA [Enterovibrio sp. ZSDZ35]MDD1780512.1 type VI secretion system protein TssA [Enterovibrio sp. ZSDZ35]
MDTEHYRKRLIAPITSDNPVGDRIEDDPALDFVDAQMMKIGSLSHSEVKWDEAENHAITLLETKSKDIKLLAHLLRCLQHKADVERFVLSIYLLTDFINAFWQTCLPAPGAKGEPVRKRFYGQILQRTESSAESFDVSRISETQLSELNSALDALSLAASTHQLSNDSIGTITAVIGKRVKATPATSASGGTEKNEVSEQKSDEKGAASDGPLSFDISSERATKLTLLKVADFMNEMEGGRSTSLRLRRFAIWFSISSPPEHDADFETPLMPVSAERISEYEDLLNLKADHSLWRKVEQSLTVSPYWIDGHYLSYRIAMKLGLSDAANAIASEVKSFVLRMPVLFELKFKGGMPFISASTQQWLREGDKNPLSASGETSWDSKRKEAFSLAEEKGLSDALTMLNGGLSKAEEPRDRFYWRLLSADLLEHHQLTAMAEQEYGTLLRQISSMSLIDWEPSLIKHLETITDAR